MTIRWLMFLCLFLSSPALAESKVVVTIKPLHALVAGVMHGDDLPELLLDGTASPHDVVLRPSQVDAMADADAVFYIGDDLEVFMRESIESIPMNVKLVSMQRVPGLRILPTRRGGVWLPEEMQQQEAKRTQTYSGFDKLNAQEMPSSTDLLARQWQERQRSRQADIDSRAARWSDGTTGGIGGVGSSATSTQAQAHAQQAYAQWKDGQGSENGTALATEENVAALYGIDTHEEEHEKEDVHDENSGHGHRHGKRDMHVWLDPENAKLMVETIEQVLSELYPGKQAIYQQNARVMKSRIDMMSDRMRQRLSFVRGGSFAVFHDGYQYFENAYGLRSVGSVLVSADRVPGARHLSRLRDAMERSSATCIFSEPQFDDRMVESVTEGLNVRKGVLDPMGISLKPGEEMYFELNEQLATSFENCLGYH